MLEMQIRLKINVFMISKVSNMLIAQLCILILTIHLATANYSSISYLDAHAQQQVRKMTERETSEFLIYLLN